eukprot:scaffold921_cov397-Prasinococcus_capsulatus_cf.AAC.18
MAPGNLKAAAWVRLAMAAGILVISNIATFSWTDAMEMLLTGLLAALYPIHCYWRCRLPPSIYRGHRGRLPQLQLFAGYAWAKPKGLLM